MTGASTAMHNRDVAPGALLLSIQPVHADRIFAGTKQYELRRRLPKAPFSTVYLYQTSNAGVVGCFDVGSLHEAPPQELWRIVGTSATSKDRFDAYFQGVKRGFAIEVLNPQRFRTPVAVSDLRHAVAGFRPPQGSVLLRPSSPIAKLLTQHRQQTSTQTQPLRSVTLRPIEVRERAIYTDLVTAEISRNYDDIDASFAQFNLGVHDAGVDPFGFFTVSKQVLAVQDELARVVGFTTLTFKRGGSVKTGPTILLPAYRQLGYGAAVRRAIHILVAEQGGRKLYCTAPAVSWDVVRYLLQAGMRIEGHLERHYSALHDELVFGRVLSSTVRKPRRATKRPHTVGRVTDPRKLVMSKLTDQVSAMFATTWQSPDATFMGKVIRMAMREDAASQPKPKTMVCAASKGSCLAATLLVPKRGAAAKGLLLRTTDHRGTLISLLRASEERALELHARKLYFLHPVEDTTAVDLLRESQYLAEGLIREPYAPGQDVIIMSRFLR